MMKTTTMAIMTMVMLESFSHVFLLPETTETEEVLWWRSPFDEQEEDGGGCNQALETDSGFWGKEEEDKEEL